MANELELKVLEKAKGWLGEQYDEQTRQQVKYLMDNDMKELVESFYKDLEFGTGGLRGIMGAGTNRMNAYTVGAATQGLAEYLKKNFAGEPIRVAVAHDSRNNSRKFAERVADIFASNGFTTYLFDALRPTPELSFAIRELKCHSGVVITASHNPKEYNGYKAYWTDGAQVTAPHDRNIIEEVGRITDVGMIRTGLHPENIVVLGEDFDEKYLDRIHELSLSPESVKRRHDMKIVYTPLHGAGVRLVPASLRRFGFTNVTLVPEQSVVDGNFPTVESPNPEERKTMSKAIELAAREGADLVLATDPDSDRIGVALRNKQGEYVLLNGNQTLVLLMSYQLTRWAELGLLDGRQYVVKTIVTSQMANAVAEVLRLPHGLQVHRQDHPRKRGQDQVHRRRRGVVRLPGGRLRARQGRRFGLLAGGRSRSVGDGHDGSDALRVVARALRAVRTLPRGAASDRPQGQGGRRADPAHDGRLPGYPARRHSRLTRGADQRLPDARNARHPQRRTHAHRAGPQQRIAVVHRGRHDRVGASFGHRAEDQVLLRRESPPGVGRGVRTHGGRPRRQDRGDQERPETRIIPPRDVSPRRRDALRASATRCGGPNRAEACAADRTYDFRNMEISELQQRVDAWIKEYGVRYFSELTNMAVLTEEVGELARVMARKYGDQSFKAGEKEDLADEMADVLWVLVCLANQTGVDLTQALEANFAKKTGRDAGRHRNNPKL